MHVMSCILWGFFSYRSFIFIHFDAVSACDELITVSNPMIAALVGRRQPLVPPARSISKRRQPAACRNSYAVTFAAILYSMTAPLQDAETLRWYLASQPLVALDGGAT